MNKRPVQAFRILLVLATLFAVTMALVPHPPRIAGGAGDKVQHMVAFATLAAIAAAAYPRTSLWRLGERLSFLGALVEVFQSIPALHRDCEVLDWAADTVAIAVVLSIAAIMRRRAAT